MQGALQSGQVVDRAERGGRAARLRRDEVKRLLGSFIARKRWKSKRSETVRQSVFDLISEGERKSEDEEDVRRCVGWPFELPSGPLRLNPPVDRPVCVRGS